MYTKFCIYLLSRSVLTTKYLQHSKYLRKIKLICGFRLHIAKYWVLLSTQTKKRLRKCLACSVDKFRVSNMLKAAQNFIELTVISTAFCC